MANDFSKLDAQDETSVFARMTTEEQAEYNRYLDEKAENESITIAPEMLYE